MLGREIEKYLVLQRVGVVVFVTFILLGSCSIFKRTNSKELYVSIYEQASYTYATVRGKDSTDKVYFRPTSALVKQLNLLSFQQKETIFYHKSVYDLKDELSLIHI